MAVGDYISEIQTSDGSTYPIGSSVWVSSETWNGKTKTEVEHEIKTKFINLTEITWSSLKSLADAGTLVPGQYYRITDYTCTTTVSGTKSAGHVFDIIVRADSVNKLNEEAHAIQHTGDSYFANNDLSAWKIWYCLDNDTTRFDWADSTNGKGVIYRMIDEFNNDVPYDFKNIQFYRKWDSSKELWSTISSDTTGVPCYTFSSSGTSSTIEFTDFSLSISNGVYSNVIKEYISDGKLTLNNNCFFGNNCQSNTFGISCYENTFGNECDNNTFGSDCFNNTFGSDCFNNTFGSDCFRNTFGNNCRSNTFGNACQINTFGYGCQYNTFGNDCRNIKFASDISASTTYSFYQYNHFGDGCRYILFKGAETGSINTWVQNYNFSQGLQSTFGEYLTINGVRNRTYETYISKDTDGTIKESIIAEKLDKMIEISYANIVTLKSNSKLVPGQYYRITDYTCTTVTAGTKSAGHVFDIIVMADSVNKLNEEAHAIQHTGDTYFTNSNLSAWRLWYCLDNDTNRFTWADNTNGKGVIYRMIDEFNNDVPYDFKNIQFYRQWNSSKKLWSTISSDTTGVACYTFSSSGNGEFTVKFEDYSLSISNNVYSNVIKEYISSGKLTLNNNCFFGNECYYNTFGNSCHSNTFGSIIMGGDCGCLYNTFGIKCQNNTFRNYSFHNRFGDDCCDNSFEEDCYNNIFGDQCWSNTFGYNCQHNTFGNSCAYNTFGNSCAYNTFGNECGSNTFGDNCQYNTFGNKCSNTFGKDCYYNTFGNRCSFNTFGNYCSYNTFGNYCSYNTVGNSIKESQFGNGVSYFSITNAQMTTTPTSANAKSYIQWLIVENGVKYVNAYVTGSTSSSSYCQNIRICQGCSGTADNNRKSFDITACIGSTVNNIYQPANSQITNI